MQTGAQPSNERTAPPVQPVRPNARRMREMVHRSILNVEERIVALEGKDVLTDSHRQSVIRISKMLETMCVDRGQH